MENTEHKPEFYKVCILTIVQPGLPDSYIRIYPADHEREKIWLDHQPGHERWAAVKQLMTRFCPRGKYVPEPAYAHPPTGKQEDLNIVLTKPEEAPLVELDGAVLSAPPDKEHATRSRPDQAAKQSVERIDNLEKKVDGLTESVTTLVQALTKNQTEPAKRPGRPKKQQEG